MTLKVTEARKKSPLTGRAQPELIMGEPKQEEEEEKGVGKGG